ncbi:hypothetical protein Y1Q_0021749 [Alligator mississippiensis]|uniref:Uncharacterized protein n=1 Tax=Alligator mississippiensis TaxID=8496 RepID=A0A151PBS3_ALLMI|nr:hypothetical protein Y1Q_0021749 [Alligator mississippiensis]
MSFPTVTFLDLCGVPQPDDMGPHAQLHQPVGSGCGWTQHSPRTSVPGPQMRLEPIHGLKLSMLDLLPILQGITPALYLIYIGVSEKKTKP